MDFKDKLNEYMDLLGCSTRALAERSGLSVTTLSRYRSGKRIPGSEQFAALIRGMSALAREENISDFSAEAAEKEFLACSRRLNFDYKKLEHNFNTLLTALSVNVAELSRSTHYDASHISRIRSGQRRPADPSKFVREISEFIAQRYTDDGKLSIAAGLIGCPASALTDKSVYFESLCEWLTSDIGSKTDYTFDFMKKLDSFHLEEYIRTIHLDEIKVRRSFLPPHI